MIDTTGINVRTVRGVRHYIFNGQEYPSVTTRLKSIAAPGLIGWARRTAFESFSEVLVEEVSRDVPTTLGDVETIMQAADKRYWKLANGAANFGKEAHVLIHEILKNQDPIIPIELTQVIDNFKTWYSNSGLSLIVAEATVISLKYLYAGTLDVLAYRDRDVVIVDWKTSDSIWPEMALQLAAYAHAFTETFSIPVKEAWILRLGKKKPDFEALQVADLDQAFAGFIAASEVHEAIFSEREHWVR